MPEQPHEQIPAQMINLSFEREACVTVEPFTPSTSITLNLSAIDLHPPEASTITESTPTPSHLWVVGLAFQPQPEQELYLGKYLSDMEKL